jgi:hypothetical protein
MALGALIEGVLEVVGNVLIDVICYGTARVLLPLLSIGWVRAERSADSGVLRFGIFGGARDTNGRFVLSREMSALFGGVFLVGLAVLGFVLLR